MEILSIPFGRVEIELYRQTYQIKQHIYKLARKYKDTLKFVAVSAFLTVVPAVSPADDNSRFPETKQRVVYTNAAYPVSTVESTVTIKPGESLAQQTARDAKEAARNRRGTISTSLQAAAYPPCPDSFRPFYQEIGPRFGVPWQIIEAIHQVESGKSCHTSRRSYAGAVGPMQFLPSTWRHYQWDCTGDGKADITNAYDAICTGAHYIGTGLTGYSLERSIYSYNRSWSYVNKVMIIAREIGYEG